MNQMRYHALGKRTPRVPDHPEPLPVRRPGTGPSGGLPNWIRRCSRGCWDACANRRPVWSRTNAACPAAVLLWSRNGLQNNPKGYSRKRGFWLADRLAGDQTRRLRMGGGVRASTWCMACSNGMDTSQLSTRTPACCRFANSRLRSMRARRTAREIV